MEKMAERKAFISIKDHKANFPNNIQCKLINPARNNLGKVTQQVIRSIVSSLIKAQTKLNLWMGTGEVLKWYEAIKMQGTHFIQFDIEAYYPSISELLLDMALEFAGALHEITDEQKQMIKTCRKSILFGPGNETWTKKSSNFDEISELIGLLMLSKVQKIPGLNQYNNGFYRDDGLILLEKCPGPKRKRIIKDLHKLFKSHGLNDNLQKVPQRGLFGKKVAQRGLFGKRVAQMGPRKLTISI